MYTKLQWVVQQNLTNKNDLAALEETCMEMGVDHVGIDVIPFSPELPVFDRTRVSVFYGSTSLIGLVYEDRALRKGLFFDNETFSMANYLKRWGSRMLNHSAIVTDFRTLMEMDYASDRMMFVRPDDDSKSFSGEVISFGEVRDWYEKIRALDEGLSPETSILVSEPYNIRYEWRLWIVGGKVVTASKYRAYFKLKKERGCPEEVVRFAEERCREYMPADIFVMDICLCGDDYYIVECGCMNAAGFYAADIGAIVGAVTGYMEGRL